MWGDWSRRGCWCWFVWVTRALTWSCHDRRSRSQLLQLRLWAIQFVLSKLQSAPLVLNCASRSPNASRSQLPRVFSPVLVTLDARSSLGVFELHSCKHWDRQLHGHVSIALATSWYLPRFQFSLWAFGCFHLALRSRAWAMAFRLRGWGFKLPRALWGTYLLLYCSPTQEL